MDGFATLLSRAHPVDRPVLQLWAHAPFTESALRVLYGYRYWPRVKAAILAGADRPAGFADRVIAAAGAATRTARVDVDLLIGITAAAIEMYDRLGRQTLASASDARTLPAAALLETPTMVLRRRAQNRPEGVLGRLPGRSRRWRITREPDPRDIAVVADGDLLAPCRGGNHEACQVGIVAGADRLSPDPGAEPFPIIRRACEARVFGRVSLLAAP